MEAIEWVKKAEERCPDCGDQLDERIPRHFYCHKCSGFISPDEVI